ncbi:MAG: hypothetical protein Q9198_002496 [Flavoplaca austrocitrina]
MAQSSKAHRGRGRTSKGKSQRTAQGLNDAYQDMLNEANSSPTQTSGEGRTVKKRRVRGRIVAQNDADGSLTKLSPEGRSLLIASHVDRPSENSTVKLEPTHPLQQEQTAYDVECSEESDFAWEEVGLTHEEAEVLDDPLKEQQEQQLDLVLDQDGGEDTAFPAVARKKPLTALERKRRLEVHKKALYRRLPKQIVSFLNPDEQYSQFRQDESFRKGLKKACDYFRDVFTVTARGMSRSHWTDDDSNPPQPPSDLDILLQKSDLLDSANKLQGSRDVGAQLFCALLRSAGVETRLVCSLQVLPCTSVAKGSAPPKIPTKPLPTIDYNPQISDSESDHDIATRQRSSSPLHKRPIGATGGLTRFSNPNAPPVTSSPLPTPLSRPKPKRFRESPNPIYWLEVYNPYAKKYTSLDPLVTHTIGKPLALTPPLADPLNCLTYVIAFNDDLTAKDVTRRYTRAYNAKILKQRIDLSPQGKAWLSSVLALFTYRVRLPSAKDEQEDTELAKKEASEPMPRNIQDFKHHPVYALERHLHRNQIIHPRQEIGRVNTGTGSKNEGKSEPIFRSKDVLSCRTADQWFRVGKEIKQGEQPLKRLFPTASSSRLAGRSPTQAEDETDGEQTVKSLYALHQTRPYFPPPIPSSGTPIPRNAFGNLDVYVPSMVPARGWHSLHPLTSIAAKILGIDHVAAVTGFSFSSGGGRGRGRGSATLTGAVVWEGHREAMEAAIEGLEGIAEDEEQERWRAALWSMWRKMIRGLRVRQRVQGYQIEGEDLGESEELGTEVENKDTEEEDDGPDENIEELEGDDNGGGFVPEQGGAEAMPTVAVGRTGGRKMLLDSESEDEDLYVPSEDEQGSRANIRTMNQGLNSLRTTGSTTRLSEESTQRLGMDESQVGGSLLSDTVEAAGGFIPDETGFPDRLPNSNNVSGGGFLTDEATSNVAQDKREDYASLRQQCPSLPPSSNPEDHETSPTERSPVGRMAPENTWAWDEKTNSPDRDNTHQMAPPFGQLTEEELVEARLLEELYAKERVDDEMEEAAGSAFGEKAEDAEQSTHKDIPSSTKTGSAFGERAEDAEDITHKDIPSSTKTVAGQSVDETGEQEEEDKGSLLSEDPSDAEAEPDWLR